MFNCKNAVGYKEHLMEKGRGTCPVFLLQNISKRRRNKGDNLPHPSSSDKECLVEMSSLTYVSTLRTDGGLILCPVEDSEYWAVTLR